MIYYRCHESESTKQGIVVPQHIQEHLGGALQIRHHHNGQVGIRHLQREKGRTGERVQGVGPGSPPTMVSLLFRTISQKKNQT